MLSQTCGPRLLRIKYLVNDKNCLRQAMTNVADRTFTDCLVRLRVVRVFNSTAVAAGNRYYYLYTHTCSVCDERDCRQANGVEIKKLLIHIL